MASNNYIYKMSNAGGFKSLNRYYDMLAGNTTWNPWEPAGAYESIATVTVGAGGSSSITFSSIPSTYQHLQIRGIAKDTLTGGSSNAYMTFNSDTGNNYSAHDVYGGGTTVTAEAVTSQARIFSYTGSAQMGGFIIDILDYTNTNKYKTTRNLSGSDTNGNGFIGLFSGLWQNTNAITRIDIASNGTFAQYSSFALYGIRGN